MKVLLVNGSPHIDGTTKFALKEVEKSLNEEGIETEIIDLGSNPINDCVACNYCKNNNECVFNDIVNEFNKKLKKLMVLSLVHPFILLIQQEEYFHFWIEYFIQIKIFLKIR